VRKVKGRFYAYSQESYREGGKIRTRTVSYLGAVDPAVARQVQKTRQRLGQLDIKATRADVKRLVDAAVNPAKPLPATTPEPAFEPSSDQDVQTQSAENTSNQAPDSSKRTSKSALKQKNQTGKPKPKAAKSKGKPHPLQMTIDGRKLVVDPDSGAILKGANKVITTKRKHKSLRPFQDSIKLPKNLGKYGCNATALLRTHARFASRLRGLNIDPAMMPDITVKYGHPSGLNRRKDGSFVINVSRKPKQLHPINKTELWKHYRQALAEGYFDAVRNGSPQSYDTLRTALDPHYAESKRLAVECIKLSKNRTAKWMLSLQVTLWGQIPAFNQKYAHAEEFGQYSFGTQYHWQSEITAILTEVQKSGWDGVEARHAKTRKRLQSRIAHRHNDWKKASLEDRLSGKCARFMRELREAETKLQALTQVERRLEILQVALPGW